MRLRDIFDMAGMFVAVTAFTAIGISGPVMLAIWLLGGF